MQRESRDSGRAAEVGPAVPASSCSFPVQAILPSLVAQVGVFGQTAIQEVAFFPASSFRYCGLGVGGMKSCHMFWVARHWADGKRKVS